MGSCFAEEIEGEFSQDGKVFRAVFLAISGAVLVEIHIEHPMQAVLDGSVGAKGGGEALTGEGVEDR